MSLIQAWASLQHVERVARLRSLQVAVRLFAGPRAERLLELLRQAEVDGTALEPCDRELRTLPTRTYRHVLATMAETLR